MIFCGHRGSRRAPLPRAPTGGAGALDRWVRVL